MSSSAARRVVITGIGVVCPLGLALDDLWTGLVDGRSGVGLISSFATGGIPLHHGAEALGFTGDIADFGN